MIRNSKQAWEAGEVVKVGFMRLRVIGKVPTPGDFAPDAYALITATPGTEPRFYRFVPHNGLERCVDLQDAMRA